MKSKHIQRALLDSKKLPTLSDSTLEILEVTENIIVDIPAVHIAQNRFAPDYDQRGSAAYSPEQLELHHYLSDAIVGVSTSKEDRFNDDRSEIEYLIYQECLSEFFLALNKNDSQLLCELMLKMLHRIIGEKSCFRQQDVSIGKNNDNLLTILLPSHEIANRQVHLISESMASGPHSLFMAIWHYVLFLNAHPFNDANGRIARLLFNFELVRLGMPPNSYFPIRSLMGNSRGGYEIRLREAEILNRWDPIIRFFCNAISIVSKKNKT